MPPQCNAYTGALWTAGQRKNPNTNSEFVWKVKYLNKVSLGKVYPDLLESFTEMRYTNWYSWASHREPYWGGDHACLTVEPKDNYRWSSSKCRTEFCFVCEDPKYA